LSYPGSWYNLSLCGETRDIYLIEITSSVDLNVTILSTFELKGGVAANFGDSGWMYDNRVCTGNNIVGKEKNSLRKSNLQELLLMSSVLWFLDSTE
jgi:hypothetical protein